ncbi:hypothetical protein P775_16550 [Puniceibacterium antarcticum]|uniref:HTH crp-type domain-containing protein n=1 Tax=Puniceibacterium antarcticum TaxID=1206336 RepID=A0A2G8RBZ2_9RHOB|nr:Crp/Fnr family transcriptional regulator [Puniceibacterium antarcticum]PIL19052.1 hypothetical protein P775_16550 [Puniceibacterium antarcticum]
MTDRASCLVSKLGHYISLSEDDRQRLSTLEKSERSYGAGTDIYQMDDPCTDLFVVKQGWLFSYNDLPDGSRQIVKLHLPGDIIGFPDVSQKHVTSTLCAAEDVVLCPFPKTALDVILRDSPRLSALILSIALRDQIILLDLLRALGSMTARARISYMLLDLLARLKITNKGMSDVLRLPLNQSQIAAYVGLTNVYVSKTLSRMEKDGDIARTGNTVHLLRPEAMEEATDFRDRYSDMDIGWFPANKV